MEILVYLEIENNKISENSLDLISYAKEISNNAKISGAAVLSENTVCDFSNFGKCGGDKLYILKSDLPFYNKTKHPYLILELIKEINPDIFILNSTTEGRELAPIVASSLEVGLVADCTKLEIENEKLISTRPTFGGRLMASILSKKNPQMATVRVNTFKKKEFTKEDKFEIQECNFNVSHPVLEILNFSDNKQAFLNLQNSKVILAGGMGLKNKENFDKLKRLAKLTGFMYAGSRKAVDKGFIEREYQIGQTGNYVAPEVYIAFGISGAVHHIVGIENSKKIIAINIDKNAPIFNSSDIGIVEDAEKILDILLEKMES